MRVGTAADRSLTLAALTHRSNIVGEREAGSVEIP
jgi:hypothetical protein